MAIGSLDRAGRLEQLRTFASVQVRAGYRSPEQVHTDVYDAVRAEVRDTSEAAQCADRWVGAARTALDQESRQWPDETDYDRLRAAFADLEAADIVVLQACDDHWAVDELLRQRAKAGSLPRGVAYFTLTDVWHAVEHHMLELNLWHGDSANVASGDDLLAEVIGILAAHRIGSRFDEGRIEVDVCWQRRPTG